MSKLITDIESMSEDNTRLEQVFDSENIQLDHLSELVKQSIKEEEILTLKVYILLKMTEQIQSLFSFQKKQKITLINGGDGEIRTLEWLSPLHAFQACSFDRSDTSPHLKVASKCFSTCISRQTTSSWVCNSHDVL